MDAMVLLFVAGAAITGVACMVVGLMSEKPSSVRMHIRAVSRLGVLAACVLSIARVLSSDDSPSPERVLLMWSLAALYMAQVRFETVRQVRGRFRGGHQWP